MPLTAITLSQQVINPQHNHQQERQQVNRLGAVKDKESQEIVKIFWIDL
jgi:hypothetical protein